MQQTAPDKTPPNSDLIGLLPYFDLLDATPPAHPGRFAFCIPSERAFAHWPAYPKAARPDRGRAASGRGLTPTECTLSGLGEAIELASVCAWGDEEVITASARDLGSDAVTADAIHGLSPAQQAERLSWNAAPAGLLDWRPAPVPPHRRIGWLAAQEATGGATRYLPADCILVGRRERGDETAAAIATTSGCAAGPTPDQARWRALLELLERDAVGRWWHGNRRRPALPLSLLADDPALTGYLTGRDRRTVLLDISTDLFAPIVAAVSFPDDGGPVAMGFAARRQAVPAARAAVCEMLQTEIGLTQRAAQADPLLPLWTRAARAGQPACLNPGPVHDPGDDAGPDYATVLDRLTAAGLRLYLLDMTRPAFGIPVMRAICPGLACDKPRWGMARLLAPDPRDLSSPPRTASGAPPNPAPLML